VGPISADPGQLGQLLLNLAINARDAMPKGGQLVVKTASVEMGAAAAARQPGLHAGRYGVLTVSDTRVGIGAATTTRIFEPFFTTKEPRGFRLSSWLELGRVGPVRVLVGTIEGRDG